MEYKTPYIAKKLGVSPKAVLRIAQQLNLSIEKNKYGHYVFSKDDFNQMLEFHLSNAEQIPEIPTNQGTQTKVPPEFDDFAKQLNLIIQRLDRLEEKVQDKADDVVNYQLLQHRSEMEEMLVRIENLEASLEKKETLYITPAFEREETPKPKRRKMILSIFGF